VTFNPVLCLQSLLLEPMVSVVVACVVTLAKR
jgi:hypothetical protein